MLVSRFSFYCLFFISIFSASVASADGSSVDKIYHPYVEQLEWELEWRMVQENENPITNEKRLQLQKLGVGNAITDTLFIEAYVIGKDSANESWDIEAYEVEALWQLTEQGEFFFDYGLLFELEKEDNFRAWEYSTTLLLEKELGPYSITSNLGLIYEWGKDIEDEFETSLGLQCRYRFSPRLEPAIELYMAEDTQAIGPVLLGMEKLGMRKALRWELGSLFGLSNDTADYTLRAVLEYEF